MTAVLRRGRPAGRLRALTRLVLEVRDAVVQAVRSLVAHQLRAALTICGISIGVATVIGISSLLAGLDSSFATQLASLGPGTLYVTSRPWVISGNSWWKFRNRPAVGQGDWRALQAGARLPLAIAPTAGTQAVVGHGEREVKDVQVRGTTDAFLETGGWQIKRGRFLSVIDHELGTDVCVIGADVEEAFFPDGDALGSKLRVGPFARCTVAGTLVRRGRSFGQSQDAVVILPLSAFLRAFGRKRGLTIAVVAPMDKVMQTEDEVIAVLRRARRLRPEEDENFSVNRQDKMLASFNETTLAMKLVATLIGLITLVVGGIGVMNILLVSVKERTREIGVRRALGARRSTILMQFLCEAVLVSAVGGVVGTALGVGAAWVASLVTPLPATTSPTVILIGLGFSLVTGLLFGLWPAWSAAALHPIEALRHE